MTRHDPASTGDTATEAGNMLLDLIRANVFTSISDSIALYFLRLFVKECSCVACPNNLHFCAMLISIIELDPPSIPV